MRKKVLGIIIPVIISIIFGYVCGKFVYKTYRDNLYDNLKSKRLYLVQKGKYDSYDEMREDNNGNNYVYYKDEDGYKTVVGITMYYDNVDKIKKLYSDKLEVSEYYVSNDFFNNKQNEYDDELMNTNDIYEVKEVVDNILNLYRSDDSIKLISIN
ncbi:MAG: hypothetical protein MR835_03480 [Erysipelotrichaceae bacterium]|nr:hypothetical protein [Erysipelotrichaceae bacterium]